MSSEPMILVEEVRKAFGARTVLDGVGARFERGKISCLVGPSGGGKSTLLRCINGLERFDAGRIMVAGIELGPSKRARPSILEQARLRAIRLKAGMVFQQYGLFAHMTALENVIEAPIHVRRINERVARERATLLLDQVGLSHRRDAFPRELSGGEQQRVAIARALAMDPEAILLDEPTSALDPERKAGVVRLLRSLAEDGATMLIVTHEPTFACDVGDYAICLKGGKVVAAGTPAEVTK
jgi:ABC-type polar amino acid transport system ATPase subunit